LLFFADNYDRALNTALRGSFEIKKALKIIKTVGATTF
jgi:hypothetical protein